MENLTTNLNHFSEAESTTDCREKERSVLFRVPLGCCQNNRAAGGESGTVNKIAEGLAWRIVQGDKQ